MSKTFEVIINAEYGWTHQDEWEGESAEAVLAEVQKRCKGPTWERPKFYQDDNDGPGPVERIEVRNVDIDDEDRYAEWESEAYKWGNWRRWQAAQTMLSALRIMSCAANWSAHESAMSEVKAAIAEAEQAGM